MKEQPGQESGFKECPSSSSTISNQMWVNLISGYGAGVICTCLCAPLDVVKIRLQVQGSLGISKYHGLMPTLRTIYQEEGIRGCYRGLSPVSVPTLCYFRRRGIGLVQYSLSFLECRSSYLIFLSPNLSSGIATLDLSSFHIPGSRDRPSFLEFILDGVWAHKGLYG